MKQPIITKLIAVSCKSIFQYLLLAFITLIAVALRFYMLGEWSFWGDEMITVRKALAFFEREITKQPISLLLTHIALTSLGTSEWSARLAPALIGVISIPILYFPIRKMFGSAVALMAGLLLAISPWHIYWSQNARFYSIMLLLYTLALLTFYFGIEEDRPWYLVLSLFFLGLATWERLTALLLMPVLVAYLGLVYILPIEKPAGLRLRNLCLFFLPGLLPGLLLAMPYIQNPTRWLTTFGWVNISPFWLLGGVVYYIGIPTICIGALGALYLLTKKSRAALLLSLSVVVPLFIVVLLSLVQYTANRYVFVSLTSWAILASVAVRELLLHTEKSAKILSISVLVVLLLSPLSEDVLYYKYQNGNRDNWKAAFALVKQQKKADDLVVVANPRLGSYYLQEKIISMGSVKLADIEKNGSRVWFVEDMNVQWKSPHIVRWLEKNAQQVANMDVNVRARNFKMRVYLYESDKLSQLQIKP